MIKSTTLINRVLFPAVIILSVVLLSGCANNCDDEKSDIRSKYGSPQNIDTYIENGYTTETWWYYTKGVAFTFRTTSTKECEQSRYSLSPDGAEKKGYKMILIEKKISGECLTCP